MCWPVRSTASPTRLPARCWHRCSILTKDALKTVAIVGDGTTTTLRNAVCDNILHWDEGWLFNLREPSELERSNALIESLTNDLTNTQMALCDVYEMIGG